MYSKKTRAKLDNSAKAGGVVLLPVQGTVPKDALPAVCDGCGAQIWIPGAFKDMLQEGNHKTFCPVCLLTRKVVL